MNQHQNPNRTELNTGEETEVPVNEEAELPIFLRDSSDGEKGNPQDEKDKTEE